MRAGEALKEIRERLGLSTRDVTDESQKLVDLEGNEEFHISNGWLTDIERKSESVPGIHKLFSLSVIYRAKFADLLQFYGIDVRKINKLQIEMPLPQTHLTQLEVFDETGKVAFPVRLDPGFNRNRTNLLSRLVEMWGEVPIGVIRHLDVRNSAYGYIGTEDKTLYPLVRPGSLVQIDPRVKNILPIKWQSEDDRPIYFVELREGYACSWCELQGNQLILIPHPRSGCNIRQFKYEDEAEIVGRVTGVAMRLVPPEETAVDETARLPKQP